MISLSEIILLLVATVGTFFMLVSAIGVLRLPDTLFRMHAVGKAATLGIACLLIVAGIHFGEAQLARMTALIVLFFVTAPIATSAISRAAYRTVGREQCILPYDDMANYQPGDD